MKIDYKLVDPPRQRRHPLRWLLATILIGAPVVVALALVNDSPSTTMAVKDSAVLSTTDSLPPVQIQLVGPRPAVSAVAQIVDETPSPAKSSAVEVASVSTSVPSVVDSDVDDDIKEMPLADAATDAASAEASPVEDVDWESMTIAPGDNLTRIFTKHGLDARDVYQVLALGDAAASLKRIHPGQVLRLQVEDGKLLGLEYDIDAFRQLHIERTADGLDAQTVVFDKDVRITRATGTIEDSLYLAGNRAGMSDKLIMELVDIFGWDINFWLDIRKGDQFAVIFEEIYRDGVKVRDGRILAAEFKNQGDVHRAVYYAADAAHAGYFDPEGHPMRKTFLRSPIKNAPVTSGFTLRRYHPVLKKWRAHRGVDYGAATGTPIRSTADGTITKIGWSNSYGKVVTIQHAGQYSTLYAHMSRFAPKLGKGARVRQGQVIGYVGQTGLATGPHLHYEFHVSGQYRDPQKVEFPKARPLPKSQLAAFTAASKDWFSQLDSLSANMVAMHDTSN